MYPAALNLLSKAAPAHAQAINEGKLAEVHKKNDEDAFPVVLLRAIMVSLAVGCAHAAIIFFKSHDIAVALGATPEMAGLASAYLKVRAVGIPAFHVTSAAMASSFSMRDSKTPLVITCVAAVLNIFGDLALVGALSQGVTGAAVATAGAQIIAMVFGFLRLNNLKLLPSPRMIRKHLFAPWAKMRPFLTFGGPVALLLATRVFVYAVLGRAAVQLGTIPAAAHQITNTLFWGASTASAEPLSVSIQAYLPAYDDQSVPCLTRCRPSPRLDCTIPCMASITPDPGSFQQAAARTRSIGQRRSAALATTCEPA